MIRKVYIPKRLTGKYCISNSYSMLYSEFGSGENANSNLDLLLEVANRDEKNNIFNTYFRVRDIGFELESFGRLGPIPVEWAPKKDIKPSTAIRNCDLIIERLDTCYKVFSSNYPPKNSSVLELIFARAFLNLFYNYRNTVSRLKNQILVAEQYPNVREQTYFFSYIFILITQLYSINQRIIALVGVDPRTKAIFESIKAQLRSINSSFEINIQS